MKHAGKTYHPAKYFCSVINRAGEVLNKVKVQTAHKPFLGIFIISHHIRRMGVYQSKMIIDRSLVNGSPC